MALIPQNQRDQVMLIVIIAALGLGYLYYEYPYAARSEEIARVEAHVDSLTRLNERVKRELARGSADELRAQARLYQKNLELMRQLVPVGNEVPALLEQVSNAARRAGLDIGDVQPQPVIPGAEFDTYRYKITVIGSYHELAEFLTNVGALTRIVAPGNLSLTMANTQAAQRGRGGKDRSVLTASLDIETYVAKPPAPGGGAKS